MHGVHGLSEREEYLFDVQGWLVVPGVLSAGLLQALNDSLDANQDRCGPESDDLVDGSATLAAAHRRRTGRGMLEWPHPHCDPFRQLIAYPPLIGYLDGLLGRGWHLDHPPEVFDYPLGTQGHVLHFGQPFPLDEVTNPGARAGDVIIFTEALAHGTLPWRNEFSRRVAVYRFAAKTVQYASGFHQVVMPAHFLSGIQRNRNLCPASPLTLNCHRLTIGLAVAVITRMLSATPGGAPRDTDRE